MLRPSLEWTARGHIPQYTAPFTVHAVHIAPCTDTLFLLRRHLVTLSAADGRSVT